MGDFADEEFHKMVCVEPGVVNPAFPTTLEPGQSLLLHQRIEHVDLL